MAGNAPTGMPATASSAEYEYSYGRQNWFPCAEYEAKQLMTNCAFFDQSSFAKYSVEGRDACKVLNHISAANIDVEPGRIVYTQWLNDRGGIEADLTVTRLADEQFLVVTGCRSADTRHGLVEAQYAGGRPLYRDRHYLGPADDRHHGAELASPP